MARAIKVKGTRQARRALRKAERNILEGSHEGQLDTAEAIADDWRGDVPVDTGELRDSIGADEDGAFATSEHAPFVELGTSTHPAQPDGQRAAAQGGREMPRRVSRAIRRRL